MACGNLTLQDPASNFWILSAGDDGTLVTVYTGIPIPNYSPPVLSSPSFYWQLSVGLDGAVMATPVAPTAASSSYALSSTNFRRFILTIGNDGILTTTSQVGQQFVLVPYPIDVNMSNFPNLGLTSSVSGATPLTVSADYSIWSCTLDRFINDDTTNIIVVLSE